MKTLVLAAVISASALVAQAGTIHYTFTSPTFGPVGGVYQYEVSVRVTGNDTSGLAGFAFNITGLGQNGAQQATFAAVPLTTASAAGIRGFGSLTNSVVGSGATAFRSVGATQFNQGSGGVFGGPLFGIGISVQDASGVTPFYPDLHFGVPAVLGTLTTPTQIFSTNIVVGGTLFTTAQMHNVALPSTATFYTVEVFRPIPEPSTFALTGLGIVGLLGLARRR